MEIPFTHDGYFAVFVEYNLAVWPAQIAAYLLAAIVLAAVIVKRRWTGLVVSAVLAAFWIWVGILYHIVHLRSVSKTALWFGLAFVLEGILFLWEGVKDRDLHFQFVRDKFGIIGMAFVLYALIGYPVWASLIGHAYPNLPSFGLAPCPTVIFTFGVLLMAARRIPEYLFVVPFLWSLLGFYTAGTLRVYEDLPLLVVGVLGAFLIHRHNRMLFRRL